MFELPPGDPGTGIVSPTRKGSHHPAAGQPLSSYLGRSDEIQAVHALIARPDIRLVTVTGPGGAGKSRLALRVMERAAGRNARTCFVGLAVIRGAGLIPAAIANALQLPEGAGLSPIDRVRAVLGREPALLVLDNLEHLLDEAAATVYDLVQTCPDLTVLGTSRTRLRLSGEHIYPLGGLTVYEARSLFVTRAQATQPDFAETAANASTIDEICHRIDRLPLAIELAAARVTVLPLPAILNRLDRRLDLLTQGPRDAPDRQRTMWSAIAWSYDLLPGHLQSLFRKLGVFVGGFSIDAAQAVTADPARTLDGIDALVAASLVIPIASREAESRFTMLETIREFALAQLTAHNEETSTRAALLQHLVGIAEHLLTAPTGRDAEFWLRRAVTELSNIRATLTWAIDLDPVQAVRLISALFDLWAYHTGAAEGRLWLDRALGASPDLSPPLRAMMLWASGGLARDLHDPAQASTYLIEAADLAQAIGDTRLLTYCSGVLGETLRDLGQLDRALVAQGVERRNAEILGEPLALAIATLNQGMTAMVECDLSRAQELFERAIADHRQSGSNLGAAIAQSFLSQAMLADGNLAGAAVQVREAIRGFAGVAAWVQMSSDLIRLSAMATSRVPESSVRLLAAVASIFDSAGITPSPDDTRKIDLTTALARTALGESVFDTAWESGLHLDLAEVLAIVDEAVPALSRPDERPEQGLSPRELEVLRLVATGKANRAIADVLSISERTVENHVSHILTKLDLDSRTAAAAWAVRHNLA